MFQNLPSRIENKVDPEMKRRRNFLPSMILELFHITNATNSSIPILMILSLFKNDFPWIYELGNETLKNLKCKKFLKQKETSIKEFMEVFEFSFRHPIMREMMHSEDLHIMFRETQHLLEKCFYNYLSEFPKE